MLNIEYPNSPIRRRSAFRTYVSWMENGRHLLYEASCCCLRRNLFLVYSVLVYTLTHIDGFRCSFCRVCSDTSQHNSHLSELEHVPDAYDLVSLMTARDPELRPSAGEVCKHPFFWDDEKRLSFLLEFSDRLEQVCCVLCVVCIVGRTRHHAPWIDF